MVDRHVLHTIKPRTFCDNVLKAVVRGCGHLGWRNIAPPQRALGGMQLACVNLGEPSDPVEFPGIVNVCIFCTGHVN